MLIEWASRTSRKCIAKQVGLLAELGILCGCGRQQAFVPKRCSAMPVVFKERIERRDLRAEPHVLFVFGDNEARVGMGGQAAACRGEPNAVGVATKRGPSMREAAMWSDDHFERCAAIIDRDLARAIEHLKRGGTVVFPKAGIGTGMSRLAERAPKLMNHIRGRVREMVAIEREERAVRQHPTSKPGERER
jgi:hypothetical protein